MAAFQLQEQSSFVRDLTTWSVSLKCLLSGALRKFADRGQSLLLPWSEWFSSMELLEPRSHVQWRFGPDFCSSCKPLQGGYLGKSPRAGPPSPILRASIVFCSEFAISLAFGIIFSHQWSQSKHGWGRKRKWSCFLPCFCQSLLILYENSHQGISHNPPLFSQGAELALCSPGPSGLVMAKGSWWAGHLFCLKAPDSAPEGVPVWWEMWGE